MGAASSESEDQAMLRFAKPAGGSPMALLVASIEVAP